MIPLLATIIIQWPSTDIDVIVDIIGVTVVIIEKKNINANASVLKMLIVLWDTFCVSANIDVTIARNWVVRHRFRNVDRQKLVGRTRVEIVEVLPFTRI